MPACVVKTSATSTSIVTGVHMARGQEIEGLGTRYRTKQSSIIALNVLKPQRCYWLCSETLTASEITMPKNIVVFRGYWVLGEDF